jgi:hypothetical protein
LDAAAINARRLDRLGTIPRFMTNPTARWAFAAALAVVVGCAPETVSAPPQPSGAWWRPPVRQSWQWQLTTPVDRSVDVQVYDIDYEHNDAAVVVALHSAGRRVVCYLEVGAMESFRPDAARFAASIVGNVVPGYPDERYVDIRSPLLRPIIEARFDTCKNKGFDAIEPDIDDSYLSPTGFPLTRADQITFNTWFAAAAHARGLAILLKNGSGLAADFATVMDGALVEQCFQYTECAAFSAFIALGKPVFEVEYALPRSAFCAQANALEFNAMRKKVNLDATREPCR